MKRTLWPSQWYNLILAVQKMGISGTLLYPSQYTLLYHGNQCMSYKFVQSKSAPSLCTVISRTATRWKGARKSICVHTLMHHACILVEAWYWYGHAHTRTHTYSGDSKSDRDGKRRGLTSINVLQMGVNPLLPHCDYCFLQGLVLTPSLTFLFSNPPPLPSSLSLPK